MSDNVTLNHIDEIYDKYADMLYRIALTHLKSKTDAEDAVHDTFYRYITKHKHFNDEEHLKAWLIKVLVNICYDMLRKNKNIHSLNDIDIEDIQSDENIENEKYQEILAVLEKLEAKYKTVVILYYLEELSIEEIATSLKLSKSAIKMRLSRARQMIAAEVTNK